MIIPQPTCRWIAKEDARRLAEPFRSPPRKGERAELQKGSPSIMCRRRRAKVSSAPFLIVPRRRGLSFDAVRNLDPVVN